jgi:uncharacterized protein
MYAPRILTAPLGPSTPVYADRPNGCHQSGWDFTVGDVEMGIWECTPGRLDSDHGDYDEMMLMMSGRVTVEPAADPGTSWDIAPGTLWVTPRGWKGTWHVHQTVRKLYVIDNRTGATIQPLYVPSAYTHPLPPHAPRSSKVSGDPKVADDVVWQNERLEVGVWECTPGVYDISRDGYDELFLVLAGKATLTSSDGIRFDLEPGSALLTPEGFRGRWEITETVRKVYAIVRH